MTEQQQACAELARMIGWREGELAGIWFPPDGNLERVQTDPPDYFTDAVASRELVAWLAKQKGFEVERFNNLIADEVRDYGFQATPLQILAADLPVIARAACKALGIEVE